MSSSQAPLHRLPLPTQLADAIPLGEVRRVLVTKLRHHGDVLLSSPLFAALKAAVPDAEIDALVYADTADMLSLHPALSQLHTIDRRWKKRGPVGQLDAELCLLDTLRGRQYDLVIHLTEHWRGAWLARLLRPRWAVAPKIPGRGKFWRNSFTHFVPKAAPGRRHTVEAHLDFLRRIGIQPPPAQRRLLLVPGAEAEHRVEELLDIFHLVPGGYVHLHPASRWLFKGWTVAGWVGLINSLNVAGWPVLLTAAPDAREQALVAAIQDGLPDSAVVHTLAGQLSLKELAAVTARAALFIGVDSAPMHIAAAVGTPVVALFGPSGDLEWAPWPGARESEHRVIVSDRHPCRPCGLDGCGGGKVSDCLVSLPPAQVFDAALTLLSTVPHRPLPSGR